MSLLQWLIDLFSQESDVRFYNSGMKLMEQKEYSKATFEFVEAVKIKPTEEKYHDAFGKSLYKRGMTREADAAFGIADDLKLLPQEPRNIKILCRLAMGFQDKRMFPESQKYIKTALAINPNNDQVHFLMGRANYLGDKFKEAILQYERAISINPYCVNAYKGLRDVFGALGLKAKQRESEELGKYVKKVSESSDDADAHAELGNAFQQYRKNSEAEAEFYKALLLNNKCEKALMGIGILMYNKGNYNFSKSKFLEITQINKHSSAAHSYLGLIYQGNAETKKQAEWELMLAKKLKALEKAKDKLNAYLDLGDFYFKSKKMDDAEESYLSALEINSKSPDIFVKIAILYSCTNKSKEAIEYCEKAITMTPEQDTGYIGKGRVFMEIGELDQAITWFHEALKYARKNPEIHGYLAQAYKKKGLYQLADKEIRIMDSIQTDQEGVI